MDGVPEWNCPIIRTAAATGSTPDALGKRQLTSACILELARDERSPKPTHVTFQLLELLGKLGEEDLRAWWVCVYREERRERTSLVRMLPIWLSVVYDLSRRRRRRQLLMLL